MGKRPDLMGQGLRRNATGWGGEQGTDQSRINWRGDERILGDEEFIQEALRRAKEAMIKREKYKRAGWSLDRLAKKVCQIMSVQAEDLQKKGRQNRISYAKGLLAYWGYREIGINGADIARFLDMSRPSLNKMISLGEQVAKGQGLKLIS
jgi:putative transposase